MITVAGLEYEVFKFVGDQLDHSELERVTEFDPRDVDDGLYVMVRPGDTHRQGTGCWMDAMVFLVDNRDQWEGMTVRAEHQRSRPTEAEAGVSPRRLRDDLSTEAWMVLNVLDEDWVQTMLASLRDLRTDEVRGAIKEINDALGRRR